MCIKQWIHCNKYAIIKFKKRNTLSPEAHSGEFIKEKNPFIRVQDRLKVKI